MARDDRQHDPARFHPNDELDEVLGGANPNPERTGCPPVEVLRAVARRQRPIDDPAYEHVARCSPCYRDFRRFQRESVRSAHARRWVAAAAVALLGLAGAVFFAMRRPATQPPEAPPAAAAKPPQQQALLDLRAYSVTRGSERSDTRPPLRLPRDNLQVSILLPVGSEPGPYELRLIDDNLQAKLSTEAAAEMKNFAATITTALDLRAMPPGTYQLAIRRRGEEWRLYQARVE
jgi:hypothetical protein